MKTITYLFLTIAMLITMVSNAEKPDSANFFMNSNRRIYRTPVILASHLVVVPVVINGSSPMNFILDSGVGSTLITEVSSAGVVSLNQARKVLLSGLGNEQSMEAYVSENNNLKIGGLEGDKQQVIVLLNDIINLSNRMGIPLNGFIGPSLFERFIVEINYTKQIVTFFEPAYFSEHVRRNDQIIPIKIVEGKPYLEVTITCGGVEQTVTMLMDTGMSFAMWLSPIGNCGINPKQDAREDILGQGLNGNITGKISRVDKVKIGNFELHNVITAFPDTNSIDNGSVNSRRSGSIGAEIFRRFNIIVDYPNSRLILRKNSNFSDKFEYDMSGLEIGTIIAGLPVYQVLSVGRGTPAEEVGIHPNDQIYSINGIHVNILSLLEISDMFKRRNGETVTLVVFRSGLKMQFKLKLRRLV
jgi:Periplasmic protease